MESNLFRFCKKVIGVAVQCQLANAAHGDQFFTDAPIVGLPASWQDTGSGVFALATASLILGLLALPTINARRVTGYALICGLVAFVVDMYLY